MKKRLSLGELQVISFVTTHHPEDVMGGATLFCSATSCGGPPTCAPACSETNGVVICKQETNNC